MANEVDIVIKSKDQASDSFNKVTSNARRMGEELVSVSTKSTGGLHKISEATDVAATKASMASGAFGALQSGFELFGAEGSQAAAVVMNLQLATDALSGVMDLATLATESAAAAKVKDAVAAAASATATVAAGAASKAWAAAQWLLNAAMDANPIGLVVLAIAGLVTGIVLAYQHSETFRNIIQAIGRVFTDVLWPALKAVGEFLWDKLGPAFKFVGEMVSKVWGWLGNLIGVTDKSSKAQKEQEEATKKQKAATDAYVKSLQEQINTATEAAGKTLSLRDAQRQLEGAIDDATSSLKDNGKTLDIHTDKGRKNQAALDAIAKAANDAGNAIVDAGGSQIEAGKQMDQGRQAFIRAATQMGMTRAQAQQLASQLIQIPKQVMIAINAQDNATRVINNVVQRLMWANGKQSWVSVEANNPNAREGRAMGGIIGTAATGGMRSNLIMVGEHGRELVDLPTGSHVRSNPDTEHALAGPGGGRTSGVTVQWVGGQADHEFMNWLRKNIRIISGGDVQMALGS